MNRIKMTAATLGLLSASFVPSLRADENNKETRMTINGPLQVQETLLAPGQYVFKLTNPDTDHSVVSIYNADGTRLEGIIMGWSAYRVDAGDKSLFTVSQSQGSQPATLKYWFYPGDNFGVEFSEKQQANETGRILKSKKKGPTTTDAADDASSTHD
jgi:hypothetical protein